MSAEAMLSRSPQVFYVSPAAARYDQDVYTGPGFYWQTFPGYDVTGPFDTQAQAIEALLAAHPGTQPTDVVLDDEGEAP